MRPFIKALALGAALAFSGSAHARSQPTAPMATPSPWAEIAPADLQQIRELMLENHPGPVDPENKVYAQRLEAAYPQALQRAAAARSFFDYKRAVRFFINSFRDGHTAVLFRVDATAYQWPGFSVVHGDDGAYRVSEVEAGAPVAVGEEVVACDGASVDQLMRERVDPYFWNADIPHERFEHVGKLFAVEASDDASKLKACTVRAGGQTREVGLFWRNLPLVQADRLRAKHVYEGEPSLDKVGDAWIVRLPSFTVETPLQAARFNKVLDGLKAHADEIRAGKVVLDVRGNAGGSSDWAARIAAAIWGDPIVDRIQSSFDWTVDWRASPANASRMEEIAERYDRNRNAGRAKGFRDLGAKLTAAVQAGRPLVRVAAPPSASPGPLPASPFHGRAYLLTDGVCASACLDFADVVRRLPNATQIGWPTSGDAVYIDDTLVNLKSGLGAFAYSMKVYRHRVRANNAWYDPQVRWPGGPATDEAVARWIAGLN